MDDDEVHDGPEDGVFTSVDELRQVDVSLAERRGRRLEREDVLAFLKAAAMLPEVQPEEFAARFPGKDAIAGRAMAAFAFSLASLIEEGRHEGAADAVGSDRP